MPKIITVFGATGNQGGSVIQHILDDAQLSQEYTIRGVTRDKTKASAVALSKKGVEVVEANLNSPASLETALAGSNVVFLVTNYWETADGTVERQQGQNVADAAKQVGVDHLLFSSLVPVTDATQGRLSHVRHFDSKAAIAQYMRALGRPCTTLVLPGYYMSNLVQMLAKTDDGTYQLSLPVDGDKAQFPLFDAGNDMGLFVNAILKHLDTLHGVDVLAAARYYSAHEIVDRFQKVTGKPARFVQLTPDEYKAQLPPATADEMLENQLFVEAPGYYLGQSLEPSLQLLDAKPTSWEAYVEKNASLWA